MRMKVGERNWLGALAVLLGLLVFSASVAAESKTSDLLIWKADRTAEARIENLPLGKVLSKLAAASGWKILVQPGLEQAVTVRFRNVSQGEALRLLLGDLSYALVPQVGGGSRLYVYETSLKDATRLVEPDAAGRPKNWLANEIILSLKPGSKEDVDKLAAEMGGKVVAKSEELNAYRIEFPNAETAEAARQTVANREDLAFHDNYSFERPEITSAGTPSPEAMFPLDAKPVSRGSQVTVALVDTPIQPLDGKMNDFLLKPVHTRDTPASLPSDPTHATSMASTMLNSIAFLNEGSSEALGNVRILPIDIYGSSGSTDTFEVSKGLYYAINSGAQVINLSLGGAGQSPMVDYLLQRARDKEILVFASAGNSPTTDPTYPAVNPNTIAVTAADRQGNIASYANRGSFVDVKAPGTSRIYWGGQGYMSTGTSTATAYISGQAAAFTALGYSANQTSSAILKNYDVNAAASRGARR
jgi:hypothetical protein